eukprot:scaffold2811_cov134-Isochrysis_galbana.AAC.2
MAGRSRSRPGGPARANDTGELAKMREPRAEIRLGCRGAWEGLVPRAYRQPLEASAACARPCVPERGFGCPSGALYSGRGGGS